MSDAPRISETVVTLDNPDVSVRLRVSARARRFTLRLEPTGEGWKLVDLESQNGTAVNGDRVNQRLLSPGDTISIGSTDIFFETDPSSSTDDLRLRGARRGLRRLRPGLCALA